MKNYKIKTEVTLWADLETFLADLVVKITTPVAADAVAEAALVAEVLYG